MQFKDSPIDHAMVKQREEEENKWSKVIERVIAVITSAASMNLPLRGHRETVGDGACSGGNFLELIQLLAQYDDLLSQTIGTEKGRHKYLSPTVQNEIICLIAKKTTDKIVEEVINAPFFALLLDSTTDISKV